MNLVSNRLTKGYKRDAGIDVIMDKTVYFPPNKMSVVNLNLVTIPKKNSAIMVCPRSSYAVKGLLIATCPVDPDYCGNIHAMVYNTSDETIVCREGEAFCQLVSIKIKPIAHVPFKKLGKRSDGKFGSTNK